MSCKHRGYFILTTFTLPHLRTYWYTGISASHSFRAVHSEFCQTALLVILTIWQPHPHCHTQLVPLQTFPHLAVLGCASHDFPELITLIVCIRLTLFGVLVNSLQGVTPSFEISVMQFSKTTFIKLFVTLGYAFVGYSYRFRRRTCRHHWQTRPSKNAPAQAGSRRVPGRRCKTIPERCWHTKGSLKN